MTPAAHPLVFPTQTRVFQFVPVPATLSSSPVTMKRKVTPRLPPFRSLKHFSCVIKKVGFLLVSECTPQSTYQPELCILLWGKQKQTQTHSALNFLLLIYALWKTVSFSRTDTGASTTSFCSCKTTVFRKSKALITSWRWSDAQVFHDLYIMPLGVPSVSPLRDVLQEAPQQMLKKS